MLTAYNSRWIDGGEFLHEDQFHGWMGGSATMYNSLEYDCVEFSPGGWRVHHGFCNDAKLPYVCRQKGLLKCYACVNQSDHALF